jgi:hypothetical protein
MQLAPLPAGAITPRGLVEVQWCRPELCYLPAVSQWKRRAKMRKLFPAVLLVLTAGWAAAQSTHVPADKTSESKGNKEMTAIVVSTDPTVKTITVKKSTASKEETLPVAETAVAKLDTVKAGEKVKLVLAMDTTTRKETVTSIETPSQPDKP